MKCLHQFEDGHGVMGDALTCLRCGYSKYPEALSFWDRVCTILFGIRRMK